MKKLKEFIAVLVVLTLFAGSLSVAAEETVENISESLAYGEVEYSSVLIGEQVYSSDDIITKSGKGTFSYTVKSTNNVSREITPILVWFDNNGVMISAQICEPIAVDSESAEYSCEVNIPENLFDHRMVMFLWNEMGDMVPFSQPLEFVICNSVEASEYNYSDVYVSSRSFHTSEDSGGSTSEALKKFMATGCLWSYIRDNSQIRVIRDLGMNFQTSVTITVGNASTRSLDFGGNYIIAPWMQAGYYWSCVNNPGYEEMLLERIDTEFAKGIRSVQFDDWAANSSLIGWNGCFCNYCMDAFETWLRDNLTTQELAEWGITEADFNFKDYIKTKYSISSLAQYDALRTGNSSYINGEFAKFSEFQRESVINFHSGVAQYIKNKWGSSVKYMANVQSLSTVLRYQNDTFCYNLFDGGIGESDDTDLSFINVAANGYLTKATGTQFIYSPYPTNGMNDNIRKAIAYSYATGQQLLVPWDVYIGSNTDRYYGEKDESGELFRFVREYPFLFDNMEENSRAGLLLDINLMGQTEVKNAVSKMIDRGIPFKAILNGDKHLNQVPEVTLLAEDDFENYKNGELPDAELSKTTGIEVGDDEYFAQNSEADGKYLHITDAAETITYRFPRTEKVIMEFDIYNPYSDATSNTLQFYLNDSKQSIISGVPVIVEANRVIRYDSNAAAQWMGTPSKQKWDHIKVIADAKTNTFDIWVNDSAMTNQPTRKGNIEEFDYIAITSKTGTNRYIDNLKITSVIENGTDVVFVDDSSKEKISDELIALMQENKKQLVYLTTEEAEEESTYFASKADSDNVHTFMRENDTGKVIHVLNENTQSLSDAKIYFNSDKIASAEVTVFAPGENPYTLTVSEENGLKYVTLPQLEDWAIISSQEYKYGDKSYINLGTQSVPADTAEISDSGQITVTTHGRGLGIQTHGDEEGSQDRAGFVYKNVSGKTGTVSAKVLSHKTPSGIMIRDDVTSNAVFAALVREGDKITLVYRSSDNGTVEKVTVAESYESNLLSMELDNGTVSVFIGGLLRRTLDISMSDTVCGVFAYSDDGLSASASFESLNVQ